MTQWVNTAIFPIFKNDRLMGKHLKYFEAACKFLSEKQAENTLIIPVPLSETAFCSNRNIFSLAGYTG